MAKKTKTQIVADRIYTILVHEGRGMRSIELLLRVDAGLTTISKALVLLKAQGKVKPYMTLLDPRMVFYKAVPPPSFKVVVSQASVTPPD